MKINPNKRKTTNYSWVLKVKHIKWGLYQIEQIENTCSLN